MLTGVIFDISSLLTQFSNENSKTRSHLIDGDVKAKASPPRIDKVIDDTAIDNLERNECNHS